jgi:hypothetical protein
MLHKWFIILYNFLFRNINSNDKQKKEGKFGEKLTKTRKHREDVSLYYSLGELKTQSVLSSLVCEQRVCLTEVKKLKLNEIAPGRGGGGACLIDNIRGGGYIPPPLQDINKRKLNQNGNGNALFSK